MKINRRLLKNKTAGALYMQMLFGFFKFFVVLFITFSILFVVKSHFKVKINIVDAELDLLAQDFVYAKGGISYFDPSINRVYPGVVSYEEFERKEVLSARLQNSFYFEKPVYAASFSLAIPHKNVEFKEIYYYKEWYDKWKPLSESKLIGKGSVISKTKSFNVIVMMSDANASPGILTIELLTPRP